MPARLFVYACPGTKLAAVFDKGKLAFSTRRELLQILDSYAGLHNMAMLDIRPYLLEHFGGIRPLYPHHKAEVAVCEDVESMLRCGD